jgi:hypothetical protein
MLNASIATRKGIRSRIVGQKEGEKRDKVQGRRIGRKREDRKVAREGKRTW